MQDWMLVALRGFNPSVFAVEAGDFDFLEFLATHDKEASREELIALFRTWLKKEYEFLYKSELDQKLGSAPRILDEMASAGLISQSPSGIIAVPDIIKVRDFTSQVRKIFHSNPRLVRWVAFYLLSRKERFSTEEFAALTSPVQLVKRSVDTMEFYQTREEGKFIAHNFDPILDEGVGHRLFVKQGKKYKVNPKFKVSENSLPPRETTADIMFFAAARLREGRASLSEIVSVVWEEAMRNDERDLGQILERDDLGWKYPYAPEKLVANLDEPMRRPKGQIESGILDLLDTGGFSNDQLSRILVADASTVSRSIKRLKKDRQLVGTGGFGEYRRTYWITNCDNCPWNYKKEDCRVESLEKITAAYRDFGYQTNLNLDRYRNQTLRTFAKTLTVAREQIEAEEFRPDLQEFKELVDLALRPIANEISEGGLVDSQRKVAKVKGKEIPLPPLYTVGLYHGLKQAGFHEDDKVR